MTTTNLATAKEVATAVASLGFQASSETLGAISRNCREDFLEHLSRCITDQDQDGISKKFIGNLLRCLAPNTINRIKPIFPDATIDMIVPVAKAVPTRFLSAIDAAHDPKHARHEDAKAYLASIFAPPDPQGEEEPPQSSSQHQHDQQEERPVDQAAMSRRQAPAGSKKYHSVHVYGSNAALCFNATDWNGAPGVMVDAAMQTGPKTYDWKNAVHVWLDINEVGAVLAVFRRWRKAVEFSAHGAQNDKGFAIEFQGQHFFAKVTAKKAAAGSIRAVKILPSDAMSVSILFLTQLAESYPMIPLNELLATVRATHQLDDAAAA